MAAVIYDALFALVRMPSPGRQKAPKAPHAASCALCSSARLLVRGGKDGCAARSPARCRAIRPCRVGRPLPLIARSLSSGPRSSMACRPAGGHAAPVRAGSKERARNRRATVSGQDGAAGGRPSPCWQLARALCSSLAWGASELAKRKLLTGLEQAGAAAPAAALGPPAVEAIGQGGGAAAAAAQQLEAAASGLSPRPGR
jgi:hypothetical protein